MLRAILTHSLGYLSTKLDIKCQKRFSSITPFILKLVCCLETKPRDTVFSKPVPYMSSPVDYKVRWVILTVRVRA